MTSLCKTLLSVACCALFLGACGPVPEGEEFEAGEPGMKEAVEPGPIEDSEPQNVSQMTFVGDLGGRLGTPVTTYPTTCTASRQWRTTCGYGSSPDISYVWRVPETGAYTFSTTGSSFDTVLEIRHYTSTSDVLACNDDTSTTRQSRLTLNGLIRGTLLLIIIDGYDGDCGSAYLNIIKR